MERINITKVFYFLLLAMMLPSPVYGEPECRPLAERPVKIEAWLSKKIYKDWKLIRDEMEVMGHTTAILWEYPAENPSRTIAIGRCVPAYIAQHAIRSALAFTKGVDRLVHQTFLHDHWIGLATSLFNDYDQARPVTDRQLRQLLDPELDSIEFHALYRKLTVLPDTVHSFGLELPNPKITGREAR